MKRIFIAVSVALMLIPLLIGCHGNNKRSYEQITPAEAKALMDSEDGYIILDVRTPEEFAERHIEGAILIPDYEIGEKAESILTDKEQLILVYCRSGRRSKNAANELATLGYSRRESNSHGFERQISAPAADKMLAISYIASHFFFASAKYLLVQNCAAPSGAEFFDGFCQSESKQDTHLARRDLAKDAKNSRRRAYEFGSLRLYEY